MNDGCYGALKSGKANNYSDAGTGDLGLLTTHETSPSLSLGDAGSTRLKYK